MRLLTLALFLALTTLALADDRGAGRKMASKRYQLRVEEQGWNGASQADLKAVYNSACSELAVHFSGEEKFDMEPIRVRHDKSGPIVLYQRSLRGELIVQLSSKGNYWSQHAYQIAHEFCHILCRFKQGDPSNLWFEESLCEMASIYALQQMSITWKTDAPYQNWKNYGKSLRGYADDLIEKYALPGGTDFATWFEGKHDQLRKKPTQRELNGVVAVQLLAIFDESPEAWQALPYLNIGRGPDKQTFAEYLREWQENTPDHLRPLVARISNQFAL